MTYLSRRELLAMMTAAPAAAAGKAPTEPVAIAKCPSYSEDQVALLQGLFDQLGGLERLVKNKTVAVKLNLTGSPALRFQGKPIGSTHYSHPKQIGALVHVLGRAGAKRIRLVESGWGTPVPLEEYMLDSGWNPKAILSAAPNVEMEHTNGIGRGKQYFQLKVPGGGMIFPSYHFNHSYVETDVMISLAKLKDHATCGVTLAMKNMFGTLPASIYGDDAGVDEPNEKPTKGRVEVCHNGKRQPARIAAGELNPNSNRDSGYRMPRVVAEIVSARPIDISIVDGIETMAGGEGPWIRGNTRFVRPGVMIAGTNPVTTDTVATAVMGYDPRAQGSGPFAKCDNTLLLAESLGVGTADLKQIEVRGTGIADAMFRFAV